AEDGIRDFHVTGVQTCALPILRRDDVGLLAVRIGDERDEGGAVGIVFQPLHGTDDVELDAAEVDDAVGALVPAAPMEGGGATTIVAPALLGQPLGEDLDRLAVPQFRPIGRDQLAAARGSRIVSLETHCSLSSQTPVEMSID